MAHHKRVFCVPFGQLVCKIFVEQVAVVIALEEKVLIIQILLSVPQNLSNLTQ